MTLVKASAKGLALVLFSVAMLPATWLRAAEEQPRRVVRLYNAGPAEQVIRAHGEVRVLLPGTHTDFEFDARELVDLALPATVIAVERLPFDDRETDELHMLHVGSAATCAPTFPIRVPLVSCRFGTAEAQVQPIAGASYRWTVEGGAILSGDGTPSVLIGFGGVASAIARVTVTLDGCVSSGAAIFALRDPLSATVTVPDGNVGIPMRVTWAYNTTEPILTQLLHVPDQTTPIPLPPAARSYTFTPTTEGSKRVKLTAALYRIGARRRAARSGSGPTASSCGLETSEALFHVAAPCANPTALVSGGGNVCAQGTVQATFAGVPPFRGRWSDGESFATSNTETSRVVSTSGTYRITSFEDATCEGTPSGAATVTIFGLPSAELTTSWWTGPGQPYAIPVSYGPGIARNSLGFKFANATACTLRSALGNRVPAPQCSGSGSDSFLFPSDGDRPGAETVSLQVTGPCGTADAATSFSICDYEAALTPSGTTSLCPGGSVTLTLAPAGGTHAGPPFGGWFYRCTKPAAECRTRYDFSIVQSFGTSYTATQAGTYVGVLSDRTSCLSRFGAGAITVTVASCP